jgi:hypothetical protein
MRSVNLPAIGLVLESLELRFDEATDIVFQSLRPSLDEVPVVAAAMISRAGVRAVVSSADSVAVKSGGAVGHGGGPLADDGPFVSARVDVCVVANMLAMLPGFHGDEVIAEARVLVMVDCNPLGVVVGRSEEAIEGIDVLEAVVEHEDTGLGQFALVAVGVAVELTGDA